LGRDCQVALDFLGGKMEKEKGVILVDDAESEFFWGSSTLQNFSISYQIFKLTWKEVVPPSPEKFYKKISELINENPTMKTWYGIFDMQFIYTEKGEVNQNNLGGVQLAHKLLNNFPAIKKIIICSSLANNPRQIPERAFGYIRGFDENKFKMLFDKDKANGFVKGEWKLSEA